MKTPNIFAIGIKIKDETTIIKLNIIIGAIIKETNKLVIIKYGLKILK